MDAIVHSVHRDAQQRQGTVVAEGHWAVRSTGRAKHQAACPDDVLFPRCGRPPHGWVDDDPAPQPHEVAILREAAQLEP
ncbi:hypothetical protein [Ornithinimicrobium cryptoxanthini]|uniref:Uncharacterized protein n=1 Tax=Ornithinimicrobium cryptoxanthini TaxID=2934161 RepID=A0ABY4YH28_9MICO|nr:hypothetical protein [Ornithinimicrobium cryptoxanthini]USQ75447.1 hypothetical protein NF557_12570 [Ornithinimicrobium cryptoxanthini]